MTPTPHCPACGGPTAVEDHEADYGQTLWLCRRYPACTGTAHTGPADEDIYREEAPSLLAARSRTLDEQFVPGWRGV